MKHKFLTAILCLGLLTAYFACEKDDSITREVENVVVTNSPQIPTLKTVSFEDAGTTFNRLKTELHIGPYLQFEQVNDQMLRTTQDTLGITIYTDVIKEVTMDTYTSYTMLIVTPNTTNSKFYNLTIEDKNGESGMFVTEYVPTENWKNNKDQNYEGAVSSRSIESLEQAPDPFIEVVEDNNDPSDPGSGSFNTSEPSPYYPFDCNGYIIITYQTTSLCICEGHLPNECNGCPLGWEEKNLPFYQCIEDNDGWDDSNTSDTDPNDTSDTSGSTNTGGGTTNTNNNPDGEQSIGDTVTDDENPCEGPANQWDINEPFCQLDAVEMCLKENGDGAICDCVAAGGVLEDCIISTCLDSENNVYFELISQESKARILNFLNTNGCSEDGASLINKIIQSDLDGSLITAFPFVKYPEDLAETYNNTYPKLTEYLENELPLLSNDELIVNALQQFGSLNQEQVNDALKWGNDSSVTIRVIDMVCCWGAYGPQWGYDENTVLISTELANELQNSSTISKDALNFFIGIIILHELTHLGDFLYNGDMYEGEPGDDFELFVTGTSEQNPNNANEVYQGYLLKKQD